MQRKNTENLGEVLKKYLKAIGADKKIKEVQIIRNWPEYVGEYIAKSTKNMYIRDRILFVQFHSSVVRNELNMIKEPLCDKINDQMGEEVIKQIVIR